MYRFYFIFYFFEKALPSLFPDFQSLFFDFLYIFRTFLWYLLRVPFGWVFLFSSCLAESELQSVFLSALSAHRPIGPSA